LVSELFLKRALWVLLIVNTRMMESR